MKPLNEDRDAARWAKEFLQTFPNCFRANIEEGDLIAWFANAMMCGEDTYRWRTEAARPEVAPIDLMAELKKKLPQSAPVAWRWRRSEGSHRHWHYSDDAPRVVDGCEVEPLYAPLPQSSGS